ncbi:MAG TPA: restriction endonuclease subunit S [Methylophilaceae bacterium]|jgi:type I restriction enzyme S subunit
MSLSRYPAYKNSGVAWLGEVPEHWEVKRLGYYFSERREKVSDKDFEPLSVTKNGVVPQLDTAAKTDDGDNRKKVVVGDFVINSRSDRKGSSGLAKQDGSVSLINTVLTPYKEIGGQFVHHLFRSCLFQEEYYRYGKGIVADLWSTNYSEMKNISLALPSFAEQTAIADFLNRETEKIDTLVAEQEKLIMLLKEKRQAIISHAVTKGLKPAATMKNSGIEWLGEVPEHWEVIPLKVAIDFQEGPGIMAVDFHDEGIPLLRVAGIQTRWATLDGCNYLDPEKVEKQWNHFRLTRGDLLISASASMGTVCEVDEQTEGAIPYTGLIRLRGKDGVMTRSFIRSLVISALFSTQIDLLKTGSTIQHFGPFHLSQMKVTCPPSIEQEEIAKFINLETAKLDNLTAEAQRGIELLKEHRSALISAAVTGKIDVRTLSSSIHDGKVLEAA